MNPTKLAHLSPSIKRGGGPSGYAFELVSALNNSIVALPSHDISFIVLPDHISVPIVPRALSKLSRYSNPLLIKSSASRRVKAIIEGNRIHSLYAVKKILEKITSFQKVVCHDIYIADALVRLAPGFTKSNVVLMTHSPSFMVRQVIADELIYSDRRDDLQHLAQFYLQWELGIYKQVRALLWPCEEAMDGYVKDCPEVVLLDSLYCSSGVDRPPVSLTRAEQLRQWHISENQFIILFIGRPHFHKGLYVFEEIANLAALRELPFTFVMGGRQPKSSLSSSIRHLGFIDDNGSAMAAADVNLCPNIETYFDLGVLQAMSLSAPMLLSASGGNKTLFDLGLDALSYDPLDANQALSQICAMYASNKSHSVNGYDLWLDNYSPLQFAINHINLSALLSDD